MMGNLKNRSWPKVGLVITLGLLATLSGCERPRPDKGPVYGDHPRSGVAASWHFNVHPLHNPVLMEQAYQPLIEYLNVRFGADSFVLEASRDYSEFEEKPADEGRSSSFRIPGRPWKP